MRFCERTTKLYKAILNTNIQQQTEAATSGIKTAHLTHYKKLSKDKKKKKLDLDFAFATLPAIVLLFLCVEMRCT